MAPVLKVKSTDDQIFPVEEKIALQSEVFKKMLENVKDSDSEATCSCDCDGAVLKKALDWLTHHQDDTIIPDEDDCDFKEKDLDEWDAKFFKSMDIETHCELLILANYLDAKSLLVHSAKALARLMSGKTVEEMRSYIMTADEIAQEVERENGEKMKTDVKGAEKKAKKEKLEKEDSEEEMSQDEEPEEESSSDSSDDWVNTFAYSNLYHSK